MPDARLITSCDMRLPDVAAFDGHGAILDRVVRSPIVVETRACTDAGFDWPAASLPVAQHRVLDFPDGTPAGLDPRRDPAVPAVAAGAFGAHALRASLAPELLAVYQTAVQYHFWHALGLLAVGVLLVLRPADGSLAARGVAARRGRGALLGQPLRAGADRCARPRRGHAVRRRGAARCVGDGDPRRLAVVTSPGCPVPGHPPSRLKGGRRPLGGRRTQ